MKLKSTFCFVLLTSFSLTDVFADSPLTSTYFSVSYYDYPLVQATANNPIFSDEVATYLLEKNNPIDVKAALINALGWNYEGTKNADLFKDHLAKKYSTTTSGLQLSSLTGDELFCLGYLMAMDNYFVVDDAINILEMAKNKKKESFTVNIILAMTKAQKSMDTNFCQVWTVTSDVLNDKSLKRDMKTAAIQNIVDYMILYKADCGTAGE